MPNLLVFRPADAVETAECWKAALHGAPRRPRCMALSRQKTAAVRTSGGDLSLSARRLRAAPPRTDAAQVTHLRLRHRGRHRHGRARAAAGRGRSATRVVSTPCWELFERQDAGLPRRDDRRRAGAHRRRGGGAPGLGALHRRGRRLRRHDRLRRLARPSERLYQEFEITAEAVVTAVKGALPMSAPAVRLRARGAGGQGGALGHDGGLPGRARPQGGALKTADDPLDYALLRPPTGPSRSDGPTGSWPAASAAGFVLVNAWSPSGRGVQHRSPSSA